MDVSTAPPPRDPPRAPQLDDYASVIGFPELAELRQLAQAHGGRNVTMVNSTATGGGVAEILNRLVPLMQELGVPIRWEVMKGGEDFFAITKAFHNGLHGLPFEVRQEWFDRFLQVTEQNRAAIALDDEYVVIHDPQPVALVQARDGLRNHWVWRCHIDLSRPNLALWNFLR
ncbi:MAG TPA: glycosyl transferase family 1, partial [Terriglobia bacterium]|nr:glycosyl transferase family 1 [Terriglobia bacterium]